MQEASESYRIDFRWDFYFLSSPALMKSLTAKLAGPSARGNEWGKTIRKNLKGIGYGF